MEDEKRDLWKELLQVEQRAEAEIRTTLALTKASAGLEAERAAAKTPLKEDKEGVVDLTESPCWDLDLPTEEEIQKSLNFLNTPPQSRSRSEALRNMPHVELELKGLREELEQRRAHEQELAEKYEKAQREAEERLAATRAEFEEKLLTEAQQRMSPPKAEGGRRSFGIGRTGDADGAATPDSTSASSSSGRTPEAAEASAAAASAASTAAAGAGPAFRHTYSSRQKIAADGKPAAPKRRIKAEDLQRKRQRVEAATGEKTRSRPVRAAATREKRTHDDDEYDDTDIDIDTDDDFEDDGDDGSEPNDSDSSFIPEEPASFVELQPKPVTRAVAKQASLSPAGPENVPPAASEGTATKGKTKSQSRVRGLGGREAAKSTKPAGTGVKARALGRKAPSNLTTPNGKQRI